jgi:hypothetical protein
MDILPSGELCTDVDISSGDESTSSLLVVVRTGLRVFAGHLWGGVEQRETAAGGGGPYRYRTALNSRSEGM